MKNLWSSAAAGLRGRKTKAGLMLILLLRVLASQGVDIPAWTELVVIGLTGISGIAHVDKWIENLAGKPPRGPSVRT